MRRLCSILGIALLALAITAPASANKKKKKSSDSSASSAASADSSASKNKDKGDADKASSDVGGGDLDGLMAKSTAKKKASKSKKSEAKGKGKADKADKAEAESSAAPAAEEPKKEPLPEPDAWEKPPMEQEKPIGPPPKPVEKPKGDGKHWSTGLLLGWAFTTDRRTGGADPYGLGFGIRGGYHFDFKLYLGLFYMYYLGSSQSGTTAVTGLVSTTSANYMQFGVEAGYDWWTGPVIIRPSLELGPAMLLISGNGMSGNATRMFWGPGLSVIYPMDGWFIGGEGRANLVPSTNGVSALLLALHGGLRFE